MEREPLCEGWEACAARRRQGQPQTNVHHTYLKQCTSFPEKLLLFSGTSLVSCGIHTSAHLSLVQAILYLPCTRAHLRASGRFEIVYRMICRRNSQNLTHLCMSTTLHSWKMYIRILHQRALYHLSREGSFTTTAPGHIDHHCATSACTPSTLSPPSNPDSVQYGSTRCAHPYPCESPRTRTRTHHL